VRTTSSFRAAVAGALTVLTALVAGACTGGNSDPKAAASTPAPSVATSSKAPPASTAPAANGIGALPLSQIFARTRAALAAAKTVHVSADVGTGSARIVITASVLGNQGAVGTMKMNGATMGFLRLGNTVYLHADAANWRKFGAGDGAGLLAGKYVLMPAGEDLTPLVEATSIASLARYFDVPAGAPATVVDWPKATVRGQQAIRLGDVADGAIYVATAGPPYPLRLQSTNPAFRSLIDLSDFNRPVTITKPPASQIVTAPKG
jgi:hypothetical protein